MVRSSSMSNMLISSPKTVQHSTLEVDQDHWLENDRKAAPIAVQDADEEKIISYEDGKMLSYGSGIIASYANVGKELVGAKVDKPLPDRPRAKDERKIMGMKPKMFFILLTLVIFATTAIGIGGGVGGALTVRDRKKQGVESVISPSQETKYANTGLAAMQWTDLKGTLHKRLYYQDHSCKIREAAWNNNTAYDSTWQVNIISDAVKSGTPIAAVAGYPHASYNYSLVKNVYYMSPDDKLFERQAPSNDSQAWEDDNFSGLYTGTNSTFLTAHWNQNVKNSSQELIVLFQDENFANGITQGRYTSDRSSSNLWISNNFGFSQPRGSTFVMSLVSYRSGKHLMLYTVGESNKLKQHEYTISDADLDPKSVVSLTSEFETDVVINPRSPLTVVAQDNQPLFSADTMPECVQQTPLTHLIIFAVPDRSSLAMSAWNCTSGFQDHTDEIKPVQRHNTTYLSLASMSDRVTGDGSLYIMFDTGEGPQVEEWTVPKRAGAPWVKSRRVTTDFGI